MKNIINSIKNMALFALLLALITPSVSYAQSGVKMGVNAANVTFDNLASRSERLGFNASVFTKVPLTSDGFMSLVPEVGFSTQGTAFKSQNNKQTLNMNYVNLQLPVSFRLSNIDLEVGPYVGYLASKPNYTVNDVTILTDAFKKVDIGLSGGINYNFSNYFVGLRYNQGLIDVTKNNARPVLGSAKNTVGQLSFGYRF